MVGVMLVVMIKLHMVVLMMIVTAKCTWCLLKVRYPDVKTFPFLLFFVFFNSDSRSHSGSDVLMAKSVGEGSVEDLRRQKNTAPTILERLVKMNSDEFDFL